MKVHKLCWKKDNQVLKYPSALCRYFSSFYLSDLMWKNVTCLKCLKSRKSGGK